MNKSNRIQINVCNYRFWKSNEWKIRSPKEVFNVNPLDGEVFANIVNISSGFDVLMKIKM